MLKLEGAIDARGCGGAGCEGCPYEATGALEPRCSFARGLQAMSAVGWLLRAVDSELAQRWSDHLDRLLCDEPPDEPRRLSAAERATTRELLARIRATLQRAPPQLDVVRAVFPGVDRAPLGPESWIFDTTVTVDALADLFRIADEEGVEVLFGY